MRTITIKKTLYKFNELTEAAKEHAVNSLSDINIDHKWWDYIYEDAKTIGAKITSFDLDRNLHCEIDFIKEAYIICDKITDNHGTGCDTYKLAKEYQREHDKIIETAERDENNDFTDEYEIDKKLDNLEEEFKKGLQIEYASILQKECDYQCSEEAIIETIKCNEYEFSIEGDLQ